MTHHSDIFKAVGGLSISATAKYIGSVIVATGLASAADLVAITGLPRSTIYRAMTEFFAHGGDSLICLTRPTGENLTCPTDGKVSEKPVSLVPLVGQSTPENSHAHASIASRATNELPLEVTLNEDIITPLIAPQPLKTKTAKRGTRLPDDWQLCDDWRTWTQVNCPASTDDRIDREAMIFANYWQALPGAKACKTDWKKTWQNWCLKTFSTAPTRPNSGGVFLSAAERQLERSRESRAIIERMIAGSTVQ
jgi:hypothetical protein